MARRTEACRTSHRNESYQHGGHLGEIIHLEIKRALREALQETHPLAAGLKPCSLTEFGVTTLNRGHLTQQSRAMLFKTWQRWSQRCAVALLPPSHTRSANA